MDYTPFAGLERLLAGEPLDGRFLFTNPTITDALLKVGAITHRHDGHARLADPVAAPTLTPANTGGTIPSDTALYVAYTFLDADGGETLPSDVAQVSTDPGLPDPTDAPDLAVDTTAGTLLANTYYYAVTVTDGLGGETMIGPSNDITVDPGFANARITVSGLDTIMADAGGTGWRLWRAVGSGTWHLMASGAGASVTDDGSFHGDCDVTPPTTPQTNQTNKLTVNVAGPAPAGAVSFNLYLSEDGSFEDPALVANHLVADLGTDIILTSLATTTGAPPPVSLTLPGAAKIDPDTMMVEFPWKRPVANAAALPAAGNTDGDIRETLDDHALHYWDGAAWQPLVAGGGGGSYVLGDSIDFLDHTGGTPAVRIRADERRDQPRVTDEEFDEAAGALGDGYASDGAGNGIPTVGSDNTDAIHYPGTGTFADGYVERQVAITSLNWTRTGVTLGSGRRGMFAWITSDGNLRLYWRDVDTGADADYNLIAADPLPAAPAIGDSYNIQLEKVGNHLHATVFHSKAVVAEAEGDIPVAMQAEFGDLQIVSGGMADRWTNPDAWTSDFVRAYAYNYHRELWATAYVRNGGGLNERLILDDAGTTYLWLAKATDWADPIIAGMQPAYAGIDSDKIALMNGVIRKTGGAAPVSGDVIATLLPGSLPVEDQYVAVGTGDADGYEPGMVYLNSATGEVVWLAGRSSAPAVKFPFVSFSSVSYAAG